MDKTKMPTMLERADLELMLLTAKAKDGLDRAHASGDEKAIREAEMDHRLADMYYKNCLELYFAFSAQGHSGGSAHVVAGMFAALVKGEPLTPLSGAPGEWVQTGFKTAEGFLDVGASDAVDVTPVWQNIRCFSVFGEGQPGTADFRAYHSNAIVWRDPDGVTYTNKGSSVDIASFPFTPTVRVVDVDPNGHPLMLQGNADLYGANLMRTLWHLRSLQGKIDVLGEQLDEMLELPANWGMGPEGEIMAKRGELIRQQVAIFAAMDDSTKLANGVLESLGLAPVNAAQVQDHVDNLVRTTRLAVAIERLGPSISSVQAEAILNYVDKGI